MTKKIFSPASFFLLRIPTWSINKFSQFLPNLEATPPQQIYDKNEHLREAIAIASPSLYNSLSKRVVEKSNRATQSISRYISRMMMRCTPFGLFSSVSIAEWGEFTTITFDELLLRKRTRLDMEWVYLLVNKLYQNDEIFTSLPIRTNPLIQQSGEYYLLSYQRFINDLENQSSSITIRATPLIQRILELSKQSLPVEQLWIKLHQNIPVLEREKTLEVVRQLYSQQFLIPQIIPSLLNSSPFDRVKAHLSSYSAFDAISEEMNRYNQLSLGAGEQVLEKLQGNMATLTPSKNYLQVDLAYDGKNLKLSKVVLEEVEKAVNLLWKIASIKNTPKNIMDYHSKFLEKYGEYRVVPLLELLDEQKGLGPLFENFNTSSSNQEWDKRLNQQWQECLFHKEKEWVLVDENVDSFLKKQTEADLIEEAPLSFDLLCKVLANSPQSIDLGQFSLLLCDIYNEGTSSIGRFLDMFNEDTQAKISQFFALEEQLEPQSLFLELSYFPAILRGANVMTHPCLRKHRLDIQSEPGLEGALNLEDIYVGATSSKFYLTNKSCQFNIITRENHLFNVSFAPLPIKFMRSVTRSQYTQPSIFSWGSIQDTAVFLPRVRYGKTILSLAKWNLDSEPYMKQTDAKNSALFNAWAARWDLPQNFFIVQGDQQLLLDRHSPVHLEQILSKLKKGENLKFVEKIEGAWVEGTEGKHYSEFCIPFVKNAAYANKKNRIKASPYSVTANKMRDKFPGSEWLYFKLYMGEDRINEFLIEYLYNFLAHLSQEGGIKKWFIIRYRDPEPHIRLRVYSQVHENSKVLAAFEEQFRVWSQLGWLKDVSLAKYEREIERYGGVALIEAAETVFYHDTISSLHIIHALLTNKAQCDEIVLHALSIVNFFRNFGLDINQMILCLNELVLDERELTGFRQHKSQLIILIEALLNESASEISEIYVMNAAYEIRKESVEQFYKLAVHLEKDRWNSIINNLLHMHCNRLGCLDTKEVQAKIYTRQALLSLLNRESV